LDDLDTIALVDLVPLEPRSRHKHFVDSDGYTVLLKLEALQQGAKVERTLNPRDLAV
jgi:hypothetical protein